MAIVRDKAGGPTFLDRPLGEPIRKAGTRSFAIVPSDTINFLRPPRKVVVGGAGTVTLVGMDDTIAQFTAVAGQTIDQMCKRINATGTAATLLVGIL